ncbi:ABC transporter permease [Variovorax sp. PCZ-1]|uniref:MlaE family ABC transporter permease n=1 Tax=Variovorax sp. PCZ-1 TaxID=2835533 RepID=UPI001BCAD012|nr:ABC transporter permease [Variovorax sp. PCZ-1]MBS7809124.1 ABC transporter permease [Variovorax sp. PCZ-1]
MTSSAPHIEKQTLPGQTAPSLLVLGRWTAAQLASSDQFKQLQAHLSSQPASAQAAWDLRLIERLDHIGAQLLWQHWGGKWPAQLQLLPTQRAVLERVAQFSGKNVRAPSPTWLQRFFSLGEIILTVISHLRGFIRLVGQLFLDLIRLVRAPRQAPWRDVSGHVYAIGATALPITALVGFLIGVVLAYLSAQQLKQFGADSFIVNLLGVSLVRELGPMLAAILIAGRSGSAITAQIGVMRVTEELDAMRVMGIPHGFRLVMPRAIALAIAMPLIAVWTTLVALLGGMLAADVSLNISPQFFINALPAAVEPVNLTLAMSKSVVFGILIALIGCHYGLRVKPNTESLGQGTTASVVTSITVVILVNAVFAIVFKDVGL